MIIFAGNTMTVHEVLESVQPHAMGWPEPPPISHGLYATREGAEAKQRELADGPRRIRATSIKEREVLT